MSLVTLLGTKYLKMKMLFSLKEKKTVAYTCVNYISTACVVLVNLTTPPPQGFSIYIFLSIVLVLVRSVWVIVDRFTHVPLPNALEAVSS